RGDHVARDARRPRRSGQGRAQALPYADLEYRRRRAGARERRGAREGRVTRRPPTRSSASPIRCRPARLARDAALARRRPTAPPARLPRAIFKIPCPIRALLAKVI